MQKRKQAEKKSLTLFTLKPYPLISIHILSTFQPKLITSTPIFKMPKANNYPLSVLFGINKPTGPPSMTILNQLQPLFSSSILFKDPNAVNNDNGGGGNSRSKGKGKWNKKGGRGRNEERIKLGQGGTLDPLADGVLGKHLISLTVFVPFVSLIIRIQPISGRNKFSNKTFSSIFRLY